MKTITFETTIENGTITLPADYKFKGEAKILIAEKESQEFGEEVIAVNITKDLVRILGMNKIQKYLSMQLEYLYIEHIKNNFDKQIEDNQIDNDDLLEKARSSAWESYQNYFLKDVAVD
jgi:hypothetical protein